MANKSDRLNPGFKAEDRATASDRREKAISTDLEKSRVETDAKTARLKALRLEKEAAEAAELAANPPAPKKTRLIKAKNSVSRACPPAAHDKRPRYCGRLDRARMHRNSSDDNAGEAPARHYRCRLLLSRICGMRPQRLAISRGKRRENARHLSCPRSRNRVCCPNHTRRRRGRRPVAPLLPSPGRCPTAPVPCHRRLAPRHNQKPRERWDRAWVLP